MAVIRNAASHWKKTFCDLGKSLDLIDRSICSDSKTRETVDHWRYLFGVWRSILPRMHEELQITIKRLENLFELQEKTTEYKDNYRNLSHLMVACKGLQTRNGETFHAVMSTLSIMESKAAIEQGHEVQKLTELAFVFIPLGFAASYFGMEIKVSLCVF